MSDLISREDVLAVLCFSKETGQMVCGDLRKLLEQIKAIPSVEPERKKGEWISHENYDECSKCHCFTSVGFNYCPYCGAEMRGE